VPGPSSEGRLRSAGGLDHSPSTHEDDQRAREGPKMTTVVHTTGSKVTG
jgi:hypothetical protein